MVATQSGSIPVMKKRAAFLNAAKGVYTPRKSFVIQRNKQITDASEPSSFRVGFTVTKKVGNAVVRNRVRRRLREAIRTIDRSLFEEACDYVLVGRVDALKIDFKALCADIESALKKLARGEGKPARPYKARR